MNAQRTSVALWIKSWKEARRKDRLLARMSFAMGLMIADGEEISEGFLIELEKYVREHPEEFHLVRDYRGRFSDVVLADGISKRTASQMVNPPAAMMSPLHLFDGMKKGLSRAKSLVRKNAETFYPDNPIFTKQFRSFTSHVSDEIAFGRSISRC